MMSDQVPVSSTGFATPADFHLTMPLYKEYDISIGMVAEEIFKYLTYSGTIDAYCIWCKKESVFNATSYIYSIKLSQWRASDHTDQTITYSCSRDSEHKYHSHYYKKGTYFTKIGQYPSVAEFQVPQVLKYRKVLGDDLYKELTKGIGLAAHGVGIGSFVYLRRIFENLVEEAHLLSAQEACFSESDYQKARMDERIQMLQHHLPEFLVENRKLYSILSTGIHELTEEDCLKYFQSVKIGIEQILDEKIERSEKKDKAEKAKASLQGVLQEISTNETV